MNNDLDTLFLMNKDLDNLAKKNAILSNEEKVFISIMSYRYNDHNLRRQIEKFYEDGATLTSWQIDTLAICAPHILTSIIPSVKSVLWDQNFTNSFIQYVNYPIFDFFMKFKEHNSIMPYPSLPEGYRTKIIRERNWEWYFSCDRENLWGSEIYIAESSSKNKNFSDMFLSLCNYIFMKQNVQYDGGADYTSELLLLLRIIKENDCADNIFVRQVLNELLIFQSKANEFDKTELWQPLIDFLQNIRH